MSYNVQIKTDTKFTADKSAWTIEMLTFDSEENQVDSFGPGVNAAAQLPWLEANLDRRVGDAPWTVEQIAALSDYLTWIADLPVDEVNPIVDDFWYYGESQEFEIKVVQKEPVESPKLPEWKPELPLPKVPALPKNPGIFEKMKNAIFGAQE